MWCWKSFHATMKKLREPKFERKEIMTDAGPISVLVTSDALSEADYEAMKEKMRREMPEKEGE